MFWLSKENEQLFLLKKNTETTEQEENISLSSKEIISSELFALKRFPFPTNTMTKTQPLFQILKSNKLNHQQ